MSATLDLVAPFQNCRPRHWFWAVVLLTAIKDQSDEVQLRREADSWKLRYRCRGTFYEMVSPPNEIVPHLLQTIRDLARPPSLLFRFLPRWLRSDGPVDPEPSVVTIRLRGEMVRLTVSFGAAGSNNGVILRLNPNDTVAAQAKAALETALAEFTDF